MPSRNVYIVASLCGAMGAFYLSSVLQIFVLIILGSVLIIGACVLMCWPTRRVYNPRRIDRTQRRVELALLQPPKHPTIYMRHATTELQTRYPTE